LPVLHVAIPHHDEARTLPALLDRVSEAPLPHGWTRRIVVCDDASPPESRRIAEHAIAELGARGVDAELLLHPERRGKGAAVRSAVARILEQADDADAIVLQDADLEYDPADHAAMIAQLKDREQAVYGSRWSRSAARSLGVIQRFGNWMLTRASNWMTGQRLTDMECGLKLLTVPAMRRIAADLSEEGFGIEPQITAALSREGVRIDEVPVAYAPRTVAEGKKIRWRDGIEALRVIRRERRRSAGRTAAAS
jgi:glycosyltransferase involved in cell wall biosynthesis